MDEIIILERVSYIVPGHPPVVEDVSLAIPRGSTTIILGPSGCGKSSLLKIAAGLYQNIEGRVLFDGEDIARKNEKEYQFMQRQTGFLFQDGALWANMSLYDNLTLPLLVTNPGLTKEELDHMVRKTVSVMNFTEPLGQRPAALSAGERKILSFLRSIVTDPDVFFMDEPTTFIDRNKVGLLKEKIINLKKEGKTIVGVTHDTRFARELADYFVLMNRGRLVAKGSVKDILESRDPVIRVFIDEYLHS